VLAALARQNGSIAIPVAAMALFLMARREGEGWPRAIALTIGATLLSAVAIFAANAKLMEKTGGLSGVPGQWKLLQFYDLIGQVKHNPDLQLPELARVNPDIVQLIRSDGTRLYTSARNDTLVGSRDLQDEFASTTPEAIARQWNSTLLEHPATYFAVRTNVFFWLLFTPDPVQCDAYYTGVDGPPQYLHELGLTRRFRVQDRALADYASHFIHTPFFSHLGYAIVAAGLIIFLIGRGWTTDIAMAALLVCALGFALSFFVIAIACDYRYLLFLDWAALAGVLYCTSTCVHARTVE
jgi:hypothetical protein